MRRRFGKSCPKTASTANSARQVAMMTEITLLEKVLATRATPTSLASRFALGGGEWRRGSHASTPCVNADLMLRVSPTQNCAAMC